MTDKTGHKFLSYWLQLNCEAIHNGFSRKLVFVEKTICSLKTSYREIIDEIFFKEKSIQLNISSSIVKYSRHPRNKPKYKRKFIKF